MEVETVLQTQMNNDMDDMEQAEIIGSVQVPCTRKQRKKNSRCWKSFKKLPVGADGIERAKCTECGAEYKCTGTTRLIRHHDVCYASAMAATPPPESRHKTPKIPETRKSTGDDEDYGDGDHDEVEEQLKIKNRIALSLGKPSTVLVGAATNPRILHRTKLEKLLRRLVRHHSWADAAGVVSVLLASKGHPLATEKDRFLMWAMNPAKNRLMYTVLLEIAERVEMDEDLDVNFSKEVWIKNVFEVWQKRNEAVKAKSEEYGDAVELERIMLLLTHGNLKEAEAAAFNLMQSKGFRDDPVRHMIVGLTFQKLWYSKLPKKMQWRESDQFYSTKSHETVAGLVEHSPANSNEAGTVIHCDSNTSVMNHTVGNVKPLVADDASSGLHREISMEVDDVKVEDSPVKFETQNFYADSAENSEDETSFSDLGCPKQYASIFSELEGLELLLLPIRLPESLDKDEEKNIFDDYYKDAVKFLRHALHSSPPVLVALHALVQLLLIGGQVKEATNEIEYCCKLSNTLLPTRLKASLLQQFDRDNKLGVSTCLEETLKKDPTCCDTLGKLFLLHQNGDYSSESLLEMLALHLDATTADCNIWREYAMCFLKLSLREEDRISVCVKGDEGEHKRSVSFNKTPEMFLKGQSRKNWKLRCRWWSTRHFSHDVLASDIAAGDLELLTYKAASAVHMYDTDFYYVVGARCCLEKENERELLSFLQMHIQNSVRIYSNFQHRTN